MEKFKMYSIEIQNSSRMSLYSVTELYLKCRNSWYASYNTKICEQCCTRHTHAYLLGFHLWALQGWPVESGERLWRWEGKELVGRETGMVGGRGFQITSSCLLSGRGREGKGREEVMRRNEKVVRSCHAISSQCRWGSAGG